MLVCVCTSLRHLLCKHAYSCFQRQTLSILQVCTHLQVLSLSASHALSLTHTHRCTEIPPNACTHTSSTQDALSSEFSDPAERRANILMDSLCLRDAFEFLLSSVVSLPLYFFLPSRHLYKGPLIPRIQHSQYLNTSSQSY